MNARRMRIVDGVFLAIALLAMWAIPHRIAGDGEIRYEALVRLFETGKLAAPRYSMIGPLFATPLYFFGKALGDPRAATAHLNIVLFTLGTFLFGRELSRELSPERTRGALLLFTFASMFPNHVQVFYGEVFTTLAVTLGVFWITRGRDRLGSLAIVLGGANTPGSLVAIGLVALRLAYRERRPSLLLLPVATFALVTLENLVMRGGPFLSGYEGDVGFKTVMPYSGLPGFSYPLVLGVLALLFSFGKGLLFFTPGLFAPLAKDASERLRFIQHTLLWFVVGLLLVYGRWWSWYGGSFWGPRFLLAASVPATIALATYLRTPDARRDPWRGGLLVLAIGFSFWVGVNGLVFDQNGLGICWRDDYALEALCHFTPEHSVLFHPFIDFESTVPTKSRPLALAVCAIWAIAFAWTAHDPITDFTRAFAGRVRRLIAELFALR